MRRNHVQKIAIHMSDNRNISSLADKISQFHTDIIERRLNASNLSSKQKVMVINQILKSLKLREENRLIQ